MANREVTVRGLISFLQECDPESEIWVTTLEDQDFDTDEMKLVFGLEYEDQDDEMSRETARKRYGKEYLRRPILRIGPNE